MTGQLQDSTAGSAEHNRGRADRDQLTEAASGDLSAFTSIYCRYRDRLYRFIYRMTSDSAAAEDFTHDAFLALIQHPERYDPGKGTLFTLLCAIARCRFIDQIRKDGTHGRPDAGLTEATPRTTPFENLLAAEREEIVAKAISNLPPLQRESLLLREYEGLSYEEIAAVVNATSEVVKARLYRARRLLAAQLGPLLIRNGD